VILLRNDRINSRKSVIRDQNYEDYWKITLALTGFFDEQFIRTLQMIVEHIDKYNLASKKDEELIRNLEAKRKTFNQEIVKNKELEQEISEVYANDSDDGSSTRKQINTFIKLGFIKPYLKGYVPAAKEYIKSNKTKDELQRIFSDTVYNYATLNSSQTNNESSINQIKFIVKTLLNKEDRFLTLDDIMGLMQINIKEREYVREKELNQHKQWAKKINFKKRKYNQISHLLSILRSLNLFETTGQKKDFKIALREDAVQYLPELGSTKRDNYRFGLMKQAVYSESYKIYNKKICWLTKTEQEGLTVSHIWDSADALREWDLDAAYDPNNALLLRPGDPDLYFDGKKMSFDSNGKPMFNLQLVRKDFIDDVNKNDWKIDVDILNEERKKYLAIHQREFDEKLKGNKE